MLIQSKPKAITKAPNLRAMFNEWQDNLNLRVDAQEIKQDTANTYARGVMKFITWLGNTPPSADTIRQWKADLLRDENKIASVNTWLACVRSLAGWLKWDRSHSIRLRRSQARSGEGQMLGMSESY